MKRKIFKTFIAYSYITLVCYVGSENALDIAKYLNKKGKNGPKYTLKIENLWKTTFKRFKETWKLLNE